MTLYRKRPVVIAAWRNESFAQPHPPWLSQAVGNRTVSILSNGQIVITTLEGDMIASEGDWIIRGVKGELYPCKPDIFAATYEEVGE